MHSVRVIIVRGFIYIYIRFTNPKKCILVQIIGK